MLPRKSSSPSDCAKEWISDWQVIAMAYDVAMPGFNTYNCNTIRLWSAKPFCEFDLEHFNQGNYYAAIADR